MLLGNTKWALDFSFYILSGIFDMADEFDSVSMDQEAFNQKCMAEISCNTRTPSEPLLPKHLL